MYVVIPLWFVPGVLDYLMHRRSRIQDTAGPKESLIHLVMMAEVGVPVWLGLLCEINPGLVVVMAAAATVHNATSVLDQRTAVTAGRDLTPVEMSIHSYLEALPFTALGTLCCLHWDALTRPGRRWWGLRLKRPGLPAGYLASMALANLGLIAVPYAEELIRCVAAARRRAT
jgi:hypothetical protein